MATTASTPPWIKRVVVILEGQHALWLAARLRVSLPILLLAEDAMSIEVQHLHRRQLWIAQAGAQRAQGRGPQEFERDGPGLDLGLHLVEQFAGSAARVDEAGVIGPCGDHQDAQWGFEAGLECSQFALRQAA